MAIVIDCAYSADAIRVLCREVANSCKKQSEIFRNVRLNMVMWRHDGITAEVTAMAYLQTGNCFDSYEKDEKREKSPEELMDYLKRFQARSKLILILTPNANAIVPTQDKQVLIESMNPFLKQKLIILYPDKIEGGSDITRKLISQ
jgi:hypothetical protein